MYQEKKIYLSKKKNKFHPIKATCILDFLKATVHSKKKTKMSQLNRSRYIYNLYGATVQLMVVVLSVSCF
jgi:hypothetical protein